MTASEPTSGTRDKSEGNLRRHARQPAQTDAQEILDYLGQWHGRATVALLRAETGWSQPRLVASLQRLQNEDTVRVVPAYSAVHVLRDDGGPA